MAPSSFLTMLFSLVVPTYNRAAFIGKTLSSLLAQHHRDFEIIVVDDGGTDNTRAIVESLKDDRVRYFWKENEERGAARNFGASKAKGLYLNFFDSDDLAYPQHLSTAARHIEKHDRVEVFSTSFDYKNPVGEVLRRGPVAPRTINKAIIKDNILSPCGVFIRADVFACQRFPHDRQMAVSEDWVLWLQYAARYFFEVLPDVTFSVVDHPARSIREWNLDKIVTRDRLMVEYLLSDRTFAEHFRAEIPNFIADRESFFALVAAVQGRFDQSGEHLLRAIRTSPRKIFSRRVLATAKKIALSKLGRGKAT